jgi:hypothetical protein
MNNEMNSYIYGLKCRNMRKVLLVGMVQDDKVGDG